jgi:general secretion pathway protein G
MKLQIKMQTRNNRRNAARSGAAGMTLLELIMACAILAVLSSAAVPLARLTVQRQKEAELRRTLREMRTAIDRYKDDADKNLIRTEVGSENYPPDLQTLVDGVTVSTQGGAAAGISAASMATASAGSASAAAGAMPTVSSVDTTPKKVRYLRKIPDDPMTGKPDWGLRSVQDEPDSHSWSGHNVFDVFSQSTATALDGTQYQDW